MERFTYDSQGQESVLIYQLERGEHLDTFAKGMLQSNEIEGILRPSFVQKDLDQFLKYPVTSKIQLQEYAEGTLDREVVLKLCASIARACTELETEYGLDPDKIVLDPEYIFVDIRKNEAFFLYLPIDEFHQGTTVKEFLLHFLSHIQYPADEDVSYVGRLISSLNQKNSWEYKELKEMIAGFFSGASIPEALNPVRKDAGRAEPSSYAAAEKEPAEDMGQYGRSGVIPEAPLQDVPKPEKAEKKNWFSILDKKEKPAKGGKKKERGGSMDIPGIEIPGDVPAPFSDVPIPGDPKAEPVAKEEREQDVPVQSSGKKKGLKLPFGKKSRVINPEIPVAPDSQGESLQDEPAPYEVSRPEYAAKHETATVYYETGSSDDSGRTVIMGGGDGYGQNDISETEKKKKGNVSDAVVRVIRKRSGQSMEINKDVFRIGTAAKHVDFYIGDNAWIGSIHADIRRDHGDWYVIDRNSLNHTYVDDVQAPPSVPVALRNGSIIRLANEDFEFIIS